ncbi:MAG: phage tail tape measure protein [Clostridiales bacterium]|nr:phage tail tape measure protein [Clostridiales bacterium]
MADLGKAFVQIVPSAEGISGSIQQVLDPEASVAGESAGSTIGNKIASIATKTIAALGIGKMISDSITNGMDFESSMTKASTLFSGTSEELAALQDEILGISSSTGIAAAQLAEAAYSAESASVPAANLGAMLENSAKLATAGFTDIDTALSATAKTMNAYGMVSDDAAATAAAMEQVQRVLIQTQNKGITTVDELGASLAQVTPTAASFGVSFEQVGAALAGMTAQGTPTAQATTQLNSLIAELGKNGTQASKNLAEAAEGTKYAGMSFAEMMDAGADLNEILDMMQGLADKNGVSMVDMFSSIEAGKAAMSIGNSDWVGNMEAMATEADVVGDAYSTMADTTSHKLETMKNNLKNLGIEAFGASADVLSGALEGIQSILDRIVPHLQDMGGAFGDLIEKIESVIGGALGLNDEFSITDMIADGLSGAIDLISEGLTWLTEHMDTIQPLIDGISETASGIIEWVKSEIPQLSETLAPVKEVIQEVINFIIDSIPTAQGILDSVIGVVKDIFSWLIDHGEVLIPILAGVAAGFVAFSVIPGIISAITGAISGVSAVMTALTSPISLVAIAIGALIAIGVALYENWDAISAWLKETWESIKEAAESIWNGVKETIGGIIEGIAEFFTNLWEGITEVFSSIGSWFSEKFGAAWDAITGAFSSIGSFFKEKWSAITGAFSSVGSWFTEKFTAAWNGIKGAFSSIGSWFQEKWNGIKSVFSTVGSWFGDTFSKAWQTIKDKFASWGEFWSGLWTKIKDKFKDIGSSIGSAISDTIRSGLNGVLSMIENIINGGIGLINGAIGMINKIPGVSISKMSLLNLPRLYEGAVLERGQVGLLEGTGAEAVVPLENNAKWISAVARDMRDALDGIGSGGNVFYITNNIDGSEDPEEYAKRFVQQIKRELRTA